MTISSLPKERTAILIMDCQNNIVHEDGKLGGHLTDGAMPRYIKEHGILENIKILAEAGRVASVPIIHVRHAYRPDYRDLLEHIRVFRTIKEQGALKDGSWGAEFHTDLTPESEDLVITKTRVSSFYASSLEAILNSQGLTHLVLTGIATDGVVEGTARDGADRGYHVFIPEDCCAALDENAHEVILAGGLSGLATVCQSQEIIRALQ